MVFKLISSGVFVKDLNCSPKVNVRVKCIIQEQF